MDHPCSELDAETLVKRITMLKALSSHLLVPADTSQKPWNSASLADLLTQKGIAFACRNITSLDLFTYFSSVLYFTEKKSQKVKFSLTSFVSSNQEDMAKIFEALDPEGEKVENYISNIMNGNSDFEVTLILLWALFNLSPQVYFDKQEVAELEEGLSEEVQTCLQSVDHGNILRFSIPATKVQETHATDCIKYLDNEYSSTQLEESQFGNKNDQGLLSKIALQCGRMWITLVPSQSNDSLTKLTPKLPSQESESFIVSTSILSKIVKDFVNSHLEPADQEILSPGIQKYQAIKIEDLRSHSNTPKTRSLSNSSESNPKPVAQKSKLSTSSRAYDTLNGRQSPKFSIFGEEESHKYDMFQAEDGNESDDHSHMENLVSHVFKDTDSPQNKKFRPNPSFSIGKKEDNHSVSSGSENNEEQKADVEVLINQETQPKMSHNMQTYNNQFTNLNINVKSSKSVPYQRLDPVYSNREHKSTPQKPVLNNYAHTTQHVPHVQPHGHYMPQSYPHKAPNFQQPMYQPHYPQAVQTQAAYYPQAHSNAPPGYPPYQGHGHFQASLTPAYPLSHPAEHHPHGQIPKQLSFSSKSLTHDPQKGYVPYSQSLSQGAPGLLAVPVAKAAGHRQKNVSSPVLHGGLGFQGSSQQLLPEEALEQSTPLSSTSIASSPAILKPSSDKEEKKSSKIATSK